MSLDIDRDALIARPALGSSSAHGCLWPDSEEPANLEACLRQFSECSRRDLPAASFLRMDQGGRDYGQRVAPSGNVFERREASRVSAETRVSSRFIRVKSTLASRGLI